MSERTAFPVGVSDGRPSLSKTSLRKTSLNETSLLNGVTPPSGKGPIDATFVLAVVLGVLLVGLTHRWIRRKIEGRDGSKGA